MNEQNRHRRTIIAEHPVWSLDIIAVSDDRRGKHPVWSTKLIAATAIILDEISPRRVLLFRKYVNKTYSDCRIKSKAYYYYYLLHQLTFN